MLIVSKYGEIQLTRGDTARLTVDITDDEGKVYEVRSDDVLNYFSEYSKIVFKFCSKSIIIHFIGKVCLITDFEKW